jgi:hypothetical protein
LAGHSSSSRLLGVNGIIGLGRTGSGFRIPAGHSSSRLPGVNGIIGLGRSGRGSRSGRVELGLDRAI